MQIKGEEFIKKVQLQQEREELERKLNELEEVETAIKEQDNVYETREEIPSAHELDNIMLEVNEPNNEDNKKKYLVLGIVLVVLFLLTIIIIRLLTDDSSKEEPFSSKEANSTEMKKIEENANIEENFQKILNDRIKKENEEQTTATTDQKLDNLDNVTNEQTTTNTSIPNSTLDETIKKIEEKIDTKVEEKEPEVKVEPKKVETKKSIQSLVNESSNDVMKGYFVQIGAFTKTPANSYINKIRDSGFKYKVYRVDVKGTMYNKVLIGPYSSRALANDDIENIKRKLNLTNVFILKF